MFISGNPEKRCPVVLVMDSSQDYDAGTFSSVRESLVRWRDNLLRNDLLGVRVEVCEVLQTSSRYDGAAFKSLCDFEPSSIQERSRSKMQDLLICAVRQVRERCLELESFGLGYYCPWLVLLTDDLSDQDLKSSDEMLWVQRKVEEKRLYVFNAGVRHSQKSFLNAPFLEAESKCVNIQTMHVLSLGIALGVDDNWGRYASA